MAVQDDIAAERQRVTERLARIDAERQKLADQIAELDAAERVLSRMTPGRKGDNPPERVGANGRCFDGCCPSETTGKPNPARPGK